MRSDLTPVPRRVQWYRKTRDRRVRALKAFVSLVGSLFGIVVSAGGATLVAFGVYSVYAPAGYVVAGVLVWALQWSHEKDREAK